MEFLKAQYTRIQEQLGGLSATQKMLTATLVAIMVMTLYWVSHYAGEPEMVPVVSSTLSPEDIGQITNELDIKSIHYKVTSGQVLVPIDRRAEALAVLSFSQALPRNAKLPFDEMLGKINPLSDPDVNRQILLESKQRELAMVISNFPGVASAEVVIDPTSQMKLDTTSIQPSAAVNINTRREAKESRKQMAESAANLLCGAQAGLSRSRVSVLIDGASFPVHDGNDESAMGAGDSYMEKLQQGEQYYCDKIRREFSEIPGLMVSVSVTVNNRFTQHTSNKPNQKESVSVPIKTSEHTEETPIGGGGGTEPGVVPNAGLSLPSSGGGTGAVATISTVDVENQVDIAKEVIITKEGPGSVAATSASVRIPRSHFMEMFKITNGGKEPSDAATLDAFTLQQISEIRGNIKADTNIPNEADIAVVSYIDLKPAEVVTKATVAASPMTSVVSLHGKEIGVGVLAVISLFMMSMMVRKSSPAPLVIPTAIAPEPNKIITTGELAGEAGETNAMLDGMELDEDTVKTQSMLDQVQQMVTENPDAAATLVKRWLNRA